MKPRGTYGAHLQGVDNEATSRPLPAPPLSKVRPTNPLLPHGGYFGEPFTGDCP